MEIPKKLYIITLAFLCNHFAQFLRFVRNHDIKGKRLLWEYLKIEHEVFADCNGINFKLNLNDDIQQEIYMNTYEKINMEFVLSLIKTGDTFFDVGANVGAYTLHAAKKLNNGDNIYAFEPEPNNLERLKINCSLNYFSKNVNIFPLALTNYIGTASLYKSQNIHSGWHSLNEFKDVSIGKVEVNTATLDSIISKLNIKAVDLIKIDIEANEFELLEGADNSLKEKIIKKIFIEFNGARLAEKNKSFDDFINLFKRYGYTPQKFNMHLVRELQNGELKQTEICENFLFEPV